MGLYKVCLNIYIYRVLSFLYIKGVNSYLMEENKMEDYELFIGEVGELRFLFEEQEIYRLFSGLFQNAQDCATPKLGEFRSALESRKEQGEHIPTLLFDYSLGYIRESVISLAVGPHIAEMESLIETVQEEIDSKVSSITSYETNGKPIVQEMKSSETGEYFSIDVLCSSWRSGQVVSQVLIGEYVGQLGQFEVSDPEGYDNKGLLRFGGSRKDNYGWITANNAPLAVEALEKLLANEDYKETITK